MCSCRRHYASSDLHGISPPAKGGPEGVVHVRFGAGGLPAVVAARLAARLEAVGAVDRLATCRDERDHGLAATAVADGRMHDAVAARGAAFGAVATASVATLAGRLGGAPAVWAAAGLVGEALLRVELLLAGGEDELLATVTAGQGLVGDTHQRVSPR